MQIISKHSEQERQSYNPEILIIDDDQIQHVLLEEFLTSSGYRIVHAANGEEGLKILEKRLPDLVLLDIQMPIMDGFKTLAAIKKLPHAGDIPVMLLSILNRERLKIAGFELGADDYITKPFNKAELLARVKAAIRRAGRKRAQSGAMVGTLEDIHLSDLLQSLEMGLKTACIYLEDLHGEIYVSEGQLARVCLGHFQGHEALSRIFLMEHGAFTIRFQSLPEDIRSRAAPLMPEIMSALATVDEVKELMKLHYLKNPVLRLGKNSSQFPFVHEFRFQFPIHFLDLLVSMSNSLKKNCAMLDLAIRKKAIEV